MREQIQKLIGKYDAVANKITDNEEKIIKNIQQCVILEQSIEILFAFNEWLNLIAKNKLESITNAALRSVFPEKKMLFKVIANRNKKGIFYDLYIETDGVVTDLLDAKGGGVLDIITMCVRITYVYRMRGLVRQTIILDEPFKNLDTERIELASEWLKQVSEQLKIQFLIVTHIPSIIRIADENGAVEVMLNDGISHIQSS